MLCGQIGLSSECVRKSISTVFLDGKPVDDIDSAVIGEGSTLALSSAMPGLVGATMRRDGFYASFRRVITYKEERQYSLRKEGLFRVKLFNLLMAGLGPLFLSRGIFLEADELKAFFAGQSDDFFYGCKDVLSEGQPMPCSSLKNTSWAPESEWINLKVCESP